MYTQRRKPQHRLMHWPGQFICLDLVIMQVFHAFQTQILASLPHVTVTTAARSNNYRIMATINSVEGMKAKKKSD